MRYAVWNNKGGVGKTFLSFILACEYAIAHPDKQIVILDLCPQANVSEIVLGGNGKGAAVLTQILHESNRRTIGGYFDARIQRPHTIAGNEIDYLLSNLQQYNPNLPSNVHLVAGDPSLEIQAQVIGQIAVQPLPPNSWENVHRWVADLIGAIRGRYADAVFFIDCNPSFATYTELAILAADRLIVPCSADGSSARAIDNVGRLVYGVNLPVEYGQVNFANKVRTNHLNLPSIHMITMNRSTQYDARASHAFNAMFTEIRSRTNNLINGRVPFSAKPDDRFTDVPDAHTVSVVCSHEGVPLSKLRMGGHQVHDEVVQVNTVPYERYKKAIDHLITFL